MLELYAIAVRVRLIDGVTRGLSSIALAFAKAHGDADKLQGALDKIRFKLAAGGALLGAGALGFGLIEKVVKPASEYAHQLNIMRMAGLSNLEIAQATADAWKNTGVVITSTATENLRAILDLRNVLGSMQNARWALPIVTKIGAVMASSSETELNQHSQDIAFSMAKALDIIGAARDPKVFEREASLMAKVITAFQNRVTPQQYQSVFQYARQAKFDLSDEFKYEFLPSLMLEMGGGKGSAGGGSRGVGPMLAAIYRVTNQGYVNKKAIPLWEALGLVGKGTAVKTLTAETVMAPLKSRDLAAKNPFLFATQVLDPAIHKKFGNVSKDRERQIIGELFRGNQLAAAAMMEFISKPQNFLRDQRIIRGAVPYGKAYDQAQKNDPEFAYLALRKQLNNAETILGLQVLPMVISATWSLVTGVRTLVGWMKEHPAATKVLVVGFAALAAAMAFGGTVILLSAAFDGLALLFPVITFGVTAIAGAASVLSGILSVGLVAALDAAGVALGVILSPIGLVVAGVAAVGFALYEMWKHWDKTKGVIWNIKNELFGFFKWIGDEVKWLISLIPGLQPKPIPKGVPGKRDAYGMWHMTPTAGPVRDQWGTLVVHKPASAMPYRDQWGTLRERKALPGKTYRDQWGNLRVPDTKRGTPAVNVSFPNAGAGAQKQNQFAPKSDITKVELGNWKPPPITITTNLVVDGKVLAQAVSKHQGAAAAAPPTGPSLFDPRLTPAYGGNF